MTWDARRAAARSIAAARRVVPSVCLLLAPALASLGAQPATGLTVRSGTAHFSAGATFGAFSGRTTAVTGRVTHRAEDVRTASGWVEVRLDSLRTGNATRDRHMRDALDTPAHPTARFTLDSLAMAETTEAARAVTLYGRFRVHGVTRPVLANGTLASRPDGGWELTAGFPVPLADHGISKGLSRALGAVRVHPVVDVRVALTFGPDA
jgi:polyisoprenoid-binding protein YceI